MAYLLALSAIKFGQQFGTNLGIRPVGELMAIGASDPDNSWTVICDDCPPVCETPEFTIINPTGLAGGTVEVTDNMDGTFTVEGVAATSAGASRLAFADLNGCCWRVISVSYTSTPENLNAHYECGAQPTDEDYGEGVVDGPAAPDMCLGGVIASSVSTPFSMSMVIELC